MAEIVMFKTSTCGACKLVEGTGVIEELDIKVINVDEHPQFKPHDMAGAPFFVLKKEDENGWICRKTHTGFANKQILEAL